MKLLISSDLHDPAGEGPYNRLAIFAAERGCALVVIAGDLLDLFGKGFPGSQAASATGRLKTLAAKVPHLAVCSGNHDPDGPGGALWLAGFRWTSRQATSSWTAVTPCSEARGAAG